MSMALSNVLRPHTPASVTNITGALFNRLSVAFYAKKECPEPEDYKRIPPIDPRKHIADISSGQFHLETVDPSFMPPTVDIVQKDAPKSLMILDSYSNYGFRLKNPNMFMFGPVAVFPKLCLSWRILSPDEIDEESLIFLTLLEPKLDIVIIGCGDTEHVQPVRKRCHDLFLRNRIGVEFLTTPKACEAFNYLNVEKRSVAACLFPPTELKGESSPSNRMMVAERWGHDLTESLLTPHLPTDLPSSFQKLLNRPKSGVYDAMVEKMEKEKQEPLDIGFLRKSYREKQTTKAEDKQQEKEGSSEYYSAADALKKKK